MTPCLLSAKVQDLQPYQPGEQPAIDGLVKLNTNENPYPPSPQVLAALTQAAQGLRRYPDPDATQLRATIATSLGVAPEQVFVGNGSDEVLAHAFYACFQHPDEPLLLPDVTYGFYEVYCRLYGIQARLVPVDADLQLDLAGFEAAGCAAPGIAGVVIGNPNAPTGEDLPLAAIQRLLAIRPDRVVLVDEAYVDFGGISAVGLIAQHPNLLVVQTLSKSRSLAGLRVGLAIGHPDLIAALDRVKNSFNPYPLGVLAQAGAVAAFEDHDYFERTRRAVIATRESLTDSLRSLGFDVLPSRANFVLVRHPRLEAAWLAARLRQDRVLVRHLQHPRVKAYLRISVGTSGQMAYLLDALQLALQAPGP